MDIWLVVSLVLAVGFLLSVNENRKYSKRVENLRERVENLREWVDTLEAWWKDEGGVKCCVCGKPYIPLNDPDYWPESNLCRDCLWKLHYEKTFEIQEPTLSEDRYSREGLVCDKCKHRIFDKKSGEWVNR